MSNVTSFAGYSSPTTLVKDPMISREDKVSALRSWRSIVARIRLIVTDEQGEQERLMHEINSALERLD